MAPTLKVTVEKIREEAAHWDANSAACAGVSAAGDGLRMTRLQAGLFQLIVDTNNRICDLVYTECARGSGYMTDAAGALLANAKAYESNEIEVTQSMKDMGSGLPGY